MVGIPPQAADAILVRASSVWRTVFLGIGEDRVERRSWVEQISLDSKIEKLESGQFLIYGVVVCLDVSLEVGNIQTCLANDIRRFIKRCR